MNHLEGEPIEPVKNMPKQCGCVAPVPSFGLGGFSQFPAGHKAAPGSWSRIDLGFRVGCRGEGWGYRTLGLRASGLESIVNTPPPPDVNYYPEQTLSILGDILNIKGGRGCLVL